MADAGKIFDLDPGITFRVGDTVYDLAPSFAAIERIEAHLNAPIGGIRLQFAARHYGATMVARILFEGIAAAARPGQTTPDLADIGAEIQRVGLDVACKPALQAVLAFCEGLENYVTADREAGGGEEAPPDDPTDEPAEGDSSAGSSEVRS